MLADRVRQGTEHLARSGLAVGAHDDHVAVIVVGGFDNGVGRRAVFAHNFEVYAGLFAALCEDGEHLAHVFQILEQDFFTSYGADASADQAVGMEERQTATKSGLESLKAKAQERDDANAKKLEEIQKRLEEMRSQGFLQGLLKAFKIIGMILGAIAAVATIAIGALTGNPLLIAAGSIFAAMTINSILSEASGGKISIASGIAELAKACGASEEVAQWIGFGMEMAITIVGCVLSFGGGFAAAGAQAAGTAAKAGETTMQAAKIADTVGKIVDRTRLVASFASGVNSVGMGVTSGVKAASDYRITKSQAEQKELEAILERIQQAITNEQDFMEAIMKRSQELLGDVGEIVQNNSETQTKLLTNASPSMA